MERTQDSFGKRIWRLLYPSLTYTAIMLGVEVVAATIIIFGMAGQLSPIPSIEEIQQFMLNAMEACYKHIIEIQGIATLLTLPILVIFLRRDRERRANAGFVSPVAERIPIWMALIALFGAISSNAGNGMFFLSGIYEMSEEYDQITQLFYHGNIILELICLGVLTPIVEELIFRGLMYTQLTEFMKKKHAILVAALLFGLYHGNLLQAVYTFALGLLMIYVYERFHTLLAPILFHIGANVFGILMSETNVFDILYQTQASMYTTVIVSCLMIIGVVWLIEQREQKKWNGESEETDS